MHHALSPWKLAALGPYYGRHPLDSWRGGDAHARPCNPASLCGGGCGATSLLGEGTVRLRGVGGAPASSWPQENLLSYTREKKTEGR